jgi:hypothetical protein
MRYSEVKGNGWSDCCTKAADYKVCPSSLVDVSPCDQSHGQHLRRAAKIWSEVVTQHSLDGLDIQTVSATTALLPICPIRRLVSCSMTPGPKMLKPPPQKIQKACEPVPQVPTVAGTHGLIFRFLLRTKVKFELVNTKLAVTLRYTMKSRMQES